MRFELNIAHDIHSITKSSLVLAITSKDYHAYYFKWNEVNLIILMLDILLGVFSSLSFIVTQWRRDWQMRWMRVLLLDWVYYCNTHIDIRFINILRPSWCPLRSWAWFPLEGINYFYFLALLKRQNMALSSVTQHAISRSRLKREEWIQHEAKRKTL